MARIKVYVRDEVEGKFRRLAMMIHGYRKGSLNKAAEEAFAQWVMRYEAMIEEINVPDDPVSAIKGLLAGINKSGVELQHEARRIRPLRFPSMQS